MKFQFETSLGMCYGTVHENNVVVLDSSSEILLGSILDLSYAEPHTVENKWLKLAISDPWSSPEYKVVYID